MRIIRGMVNMARGLAVGLVRLPVSTESNVPVPITGDEYRRYPYMCWSAPVNRLRYGRELRRAHGAGAVGGRPPQTFYLVREAEDARFELARGCPQHAFQVCG